MNRQDALNDALDRLYNVGLRIKLGPLLPDFAAHGPMAAEAMSTMGYNDPVAAWVDLYKERRRHLPMPPPKEPIRREKDSWADALGDPKRTTDWVSFFTGELAANPYQDVLGTWIPRLMTGYAGGLGHGLIRTAYAVRGFPPDGRPSTLQLDELARGLGFWGSVYERLPGDVADQPRFEDAISNLRNLDDVDSAISSHSSTFCRFTLAHDEVFPIPLIHTVTAPVCMRNLLPYVAPEAAPGIYRMLWRGSAAIIARFVGERHEETNARGFEPASLSAEQLAAKAVEHGDEHAIKFTEACLREDVIRPDPVYRATAEAMLGRLRPMRATSDMSPGR